jgi:LmbE family N-acetylglucosaminyl deacetylase
MSLEENGSRIPPRVLAVMAHPDDAEILVGGTLLLLGLAGCPLGIITMTAGDCGSATLSQEQIATIRMGEARAAAAQLGASYACAGLRDVEVFCTADNVRTVVELMREFDPDVVLTHSPVDYMVDHEETSRLARTAAFAVAMPLYDTHRSAPSPRSRRTPALYYADPVEGTDAGGRRIAPQFYVDITSQIECKRNLLARHASQREWLRSHHGIDEYILQMVAWAGRYGSECGCPLAEGLRQHLGHGYPSDARLQSMLPGHIRTETPDRTAARE